jgi:broad specificity phosphatase PhoE
LEKEIFIIRHGETDFNQLGIVQGKGVNSSINAKGMQQAQAFFEAYRNENFEKIYISQLQRTAQTN